MIDYPEIPLPLLNLQGEVAVSNIRSSLTNGMVEQNSRYGAKLKTYTANWKLSQAEFFIFEEWFSDTLKGGVLTFEMDGVGDGEIDLQPFRFVEGTFSSSITGGRFYNVQATIESLLPGNALVNAVLPVPMWERLLIDPVSDQELTLGHRNSILVSRPADGDTRTLRVFPPNDATQYIYFGIRNFGDGETLITSADVDPMPPDPVFSFPTSLPLPDMGMVDRGERRTGRIEMDSGHPRQWVEWDTTRKSYIAMWTLTLDQLKDFQDFYFFSLRNGTLRFLIEIPGTGDFSAKAVRFVGGTYQEAYLAGDYWQVSAEMEQVVDQTVFPSNAQPYGLYYSPSVTVNANRKIKAADANKFFIVNPDEGQTISLHISSQEIEFGILKTGPGNVLITRGPFIVDVGEIPSDASGQVILPAAFTLKNTINDIGAIPGDTTGQSILTTTFNLVSVIEDIGAVPGDSSGQTVLPTTMSILDVLVDTGEVPPDNSGQSFKPTTFTLDIP